MNQNKIAVIGAGNWGKNLIRVCHELGVLKSVCDHNPEQAMKYANEYNVAHMSFQEILADNSITAVIIAVPAILHAQYVEQALQADKHVMVEKPLAMDYVSANKLCLLAKERNKTLMVGHILQYHNAYIELKYLLSSGEIGDIKYIESTRLHMGPVRYDAGILWELLPHDVSMLLGIYNGAVNNISVNQQHFYTTNNYSAANYGDVLDINIKFANGILARVYSSWLHPRKEQKLWVAGTKGMLVFEDTENWPNKLKLFKYNKANKANRSNSQSIVNEQTIALTPLEPLKAEVNHFLSGITNGTAVVTDGWEGLKVVQLLGEIEKKLQQGVNVHTVSQTETVI